MTDLDFDRPDRGKPVGLAPHAVAASCTRTITHPASRNLKPGYVLDTHGSALDATPIKCWQKTKKGAPVDWRGPTVW